MKKLSHSIFAPWLAWPRPDSHSRRHFVTTSWFTFTRPFCSTSSSWRDVNGHFEQHCQRAQRPFFTPRRACSQLLVIELPLRPDIVFIYDKDLSIWAYPKTPGFFEDALVCCIRENPEPVVFKVSCHGVRPELELDRKQLQFDRVLLHR